MCGERVDGQYAQIGEVAFLSSSGQSLSEVAKQKGWGKVKEEG